MAKRYAGIDVGGRAKGFHLAVVDGSAVELFQTVKPREAVAWLADRAPSVVAVDSPCDAAKSGRVRRKGERRLAREVCQIRYTPDLTTMEAREDDYYGWILNGLRMYKRLEKGAGRAGWDVIECFPTAAFTRWAGPRGKRTRASWTADALRSFALEGLPPRLGQDHRDAVAAALTARMHAEGRTERFGRIVVPTASS